ncbi:MAG: hypothetical protein ACYC63_05360 [Armatimonadota bacterium]
MRATKPKVARQVKAEFDVYAFLSRWARSLFQICVGAFIISLAYILYGMFSGALNQQNVDPSRIAGNLRTMGQILALSGTLGALAFIFLTVSEFALAIVVGIVGAGLLFGMPVLVANNLSNVNLQIVAVINEWTKNAGMGILAVVGLRIMYEIVETVRTAATRRKEREESEESTGLKKAKKVQGPGVWSPCWKLPYCHDAVREHCPAFKAKKSCWRFGYGCNCDPSLIESLIRSGALDTAKSASRQSATQKAQAAAYVRSDLQADAPVRAKERTIPCSKCPIYLDHQRQKFKIVNPIAIIASLVLLGLAYKPLMSIYSMLIALISKLVSGLSYQGINASAWFEYLDITPIKVFFFIIVGLLALAYVLKFVEWAIFEKKL